MSKHSQYTKSEIKKELQSKLAVILPNEQLYDAKADCQHVIHNAPGGDIKCMLCGGWYCN